MQAKLLIIDGRASSSEIELKKLPLTIGRGEQAWLRLKHPTISRKHCEISEMGGKLFVRDCGSANGTLIDGEPITEAVLEPGHTLTIGPLTFEARYQPSLNGKGEEHPSEVVAECTVDPMADAMLAEPDQPSLKSPSEVSQPTAEQAAEATGSSDSDDFSLLLDDEADLIEPPLVVEDATSDEPAATIEVDEASPEGVELESDFELDLKLDDEIDVEKVAAPDVDDALDVPSGESPSDETNAALTTDAPGATIEADSSELAALVSRESESDFELDLSLDDSPEVKELATADSEVKEPLAVVDDTEENEPAAVTEDIENVRDFSGPMVDMPSRILFSVDEIEEPLVDLSDESSATDEGVAAGETADAESDTPLVESLGPEITDLESTDEEAEEVADLKANEEARTTAAERPPESEATDDSLDVALDADTADGDPSDITDLVEGLVEESSDTPDSIVADEAITGEATNKTVVEDAISALDLELESDDNDLLMQQEVDEVVDQAEVVSEATDEDSFELDDLKSDFHEDSSEFEDSAELQWSDAKLVDAEPRGEEETAEVDAASELDLSEMALEAIDESSDPLPDRGDGNAIAEPAAEPEKAAMDLSQFAFDALEAPAIKTPSDVESAATAAESEAEPPRLDLSRMALDAIGVPSTDSDSVTPPAENVGPVAKELVDLSEVAFDAVEDATASDELPRELEPDSPSNVEDLDLSELREPPDSIQPLATEDGSGPDAPHVEQPAGEADVDAVDFFSTPEAEEEAVDLESGADSQIDDLDLSELDFDAIARSETDQDASSEGFDLDLPEVEFDAVDDLSEPDGTPLPVAAEAVSEDDVSDRLVAAEANAEVPFELESENDSGSESDDFEVPGLEEHVTQPVDGVSGESEDEQPVKIECEAASDAESEDFSEFDFGSDEDASSEISMDDESLRLDLPTAEELSSSPTSDAMDESVAAVADDSPKKKKRGWWPFGRKAKTSEARAAARTDQPVDVEPSMADSEAAAENGVDALGLDSVDATSDEFDAVALFGEPSAEGDLGTDDVPRMPVDEEPVVFEADEAVEAGAVDTDAPPDDLVKDLLHEDEEPDALAMPMIDGHEDGHEDVELKVADASVEGDRDEFGEVASNAVAEVDLGPDETSDVADLDVPTFEEDDSDAVGFEPLDDEESSGSGETVAEIEIDDEPAPSTNGSSVVDEPSPETKPKRKWWSLGKKSTGEKSAKKKAKTPKAKRGWGRRKKQVDASRTEEADSPIIAETADSPSFDEPVTFDETNDDDSFIAPPDTADDDAMSFLIDASEGLPDSDMVDNDDVPDFAAFEDEAAGSATDDADEDSGEFLKQLDL